MSASPSNADLESILGDFIEFYLLSDHPQKTIQLAQLKVRNAKPDTADTDPLLHSVTLLTVALKELQGLRKLHPFVPSLTQNAAQNSQNERKLYHEITNLDPVDCLLVLTEKRYPLDEPTLSLVLKRTQENIRFRRTQLLDQLKEEGLPTEKIVSLNPKKLLENETPAHTLAHPRLSNSVNHRIHRLPFAVRFGIETAAVLLILVLMMWIIPEIRNRYENTIQKRINDYLIESTLVDSPPPEGTTKEPKKAVAPEPETMPQNHEAEAEEEIGAYANKKQPKVSDGETWRFSFTGAYTNDLETGIVRILKDHGKPTSVPGGIQFDFVLPVSSLISLKKDLEDMTFQVQKRALHSASASDTNSARQAAMSAANMSWFKKRMNGRKIPSGHVQVIIWISTL